MRPHESETLVNDYRVQLWGPLPPSGELLDFNVSWPPEAPYPRALCRAKLLPWDTRVLETPAARLEVIWASSETSLPLLDLALTQILEEMDQSGVEFCDLRIGLGSPALVQLAEAHGFQMVDMMAIYLGKRKLTKLSIIPAGFRLHRFSPPNPGHLARSVEAVASSFIYSRVYNDPRIPRIKAEHFQRELMRGLWNDTENRLGLALDENGQTAGFYLAGRDEDPRVPGGIGVLRLIGVDQGRAGRGLGLALLEDFFECMLEHTKILEIATQVNNKPANALYQRAGLRPSGHLASFHRWRP